MWRQFSKLPRILQPVFSTQPDLVQPTISCLRSFSLLSSNIISRNVTPNTCGQLTTKSLLQPASLVQSFDRGMKQMGNLKRRCKDCYFVMRHERMYVMCKTHPRHKQMGMKKKDKNTWILTDATQSPLRAW